MIRRKKESASLKIEAIAPAKFHRTRFSNEEFSKILNHSWLSNYPV
jgi:hypothetical protein